MKRLKVLDLSYNKLAESCGYFLARIISKHGERRDTLKWERELRGSVSDVPEGLIELYLNFNSLSDSGWEKIIESLISDNWLRLVDAKNNNLTLKSFLGTKNLFENNKKILILDLRENQELDRKFVNILKLFEKNFEYAEGFSDVEKYFSMLDNIYNDKGLPIIRDIHALNQREKKFNKSLKNRANSTMIEKNVMSPVFISMIAQEYEIISKKNRRLKKKLGNSMRTQNKRKDNNRLIKTIRKYKTDD